MRKKLLYIHMLTHVHIHIIYTCVCIYVWCESCSVVSDSLWSHGLYSPWNSPGQNTVAGSLSLLQSIFPRQGSNPGLPHCRQILYQPSHKGRPYIYIYIRRTRRKVYNILVRQREGEASHRILCTIWFLLKNEKHNVLIYTYTLNC